MSADPEVEQLALLGVAHAMCGHVRVRADDRGGEYALTCTRYPHDETVEHHYTWLTELRRIDPVVVRDEVL